MNKDCRSLKTRLAALLGLVLTAVVLSGCPFNPSAEETSVQDAQALADSITYVKAKNGLCFGVTTTSKFSTSGSISMSNQMVHVPCEAVVLSAQIK